MLVAMFTKSIIRLFPLVYMYLIWYQSGHFQPPPDVPPLPWLTIISLGALLEIAHFVEFGILYILLILALLTYGPLTRRKVVFAIAVSVLYAFSDEIHQYFVPFRSFSVTDLLKDVVGIALAWFVIRKAYYAEHSRVGKFLRKLAASNAKTYEL